MKTIDTTRSRATHAKDAKMKTAIKGFLTLSLLAATSLPWVVQAQNECGDPDANGASADSFTCATGNANQSTGITYSTNGNLTLSIPGAANVGAFGIDLDGNNNNSITFNASGNLTSSSGVQRVLDVETSGGNITLNTSGITANTSTGTHGIRAVANGSNNITITTGGSINATSSSAGVAGIEARSNGGNVTINTNASVFGGTNSSLSAPNGHGILAETSGSGRIRMNIGGELGAITLIQAAASNAAAAIEAIATGATTGDNNNIQIDVSDVSIQGRSGVGVKLHSGGLAVLNFSGPGGGGSPGARSISGNVAAIQASGDRVRVNLSAAQGNRHVGHLYRLLGAVDFSGLTGASALNIGQNAHWELGGNSQGSAGDDRFNILEGGVLRLGLAPGGSGALEYLDAPHIDFGTGADTLRNQGQIWVGTHLLSNTSFLNPDPTLRPSFLNDNFEGQMQFENLNTFQNEGSIYLGAALYSRSTDDNGAQPGQVVPGVRWQVMDTDRYPDDLLIMHGTNFVGGENSRLLLDVDLNQSVQTGCGEELRAAETGDLPAADCLDLRNGGATGRTNVVINDVIPDDRGAPSPQGIVLVDLSTMNGEEGGFVSSTAFVIDPMSENYNPALGGVIDKGLFWYPLAYDAEARQFKLYGVPGAVGQQQPIMASAAQQVWRSGAGTWFDRQADQRDAERDGQDGGGVWMRANSETAARSVNSVSAAVGNTFVIENHHDLDTWTLNIGLDLLKGRTAQQRWVLGGTFGYSHAGMSFDSSAASARLDGVNFGFYGGFVGEHLFVDALVAGNWLKQRHDAPSLGLDPETAILNGRIESYGAQMEAGWRFGSDAAHIEPLLSLAYVSSDFDDVEAPAGDPTRDGAIVTWDTPKSFRGGLGLRGSVVMPTDALQVTLSLTARSVNEFEGENTAGLSGTGGAVVSAVDDFSGTFTEIAPGIGIANRSGSVSGALNLNLKYGDDYESTGFSAGVRYQW